MPDRSSRAKILGLFLLVSIATGIGTVYWLRGGVFGQAGFSFTVRFPQAGGINIGSAVRFRGVQVGRVTSIKPQTNTVEVEVLINNSQLAIPLQSSVETIQGNLLGDTNIEIFPQADLDDRPNLEPTSPNCDRNLIICQGQSVVGKSGVSFTELLRESGQFFRRVNDDQLFADLKSTLKNASAAAENISKLTTSLNRILGAVDDAIARFSDTTTKISNAAQSAETLINESRLSLAQTLDSIADASRQAEQLIASARPLLADGTLITDLRQLAASASATAADLRKITSEFSDPSTLNTLRETIESARTTFANAQKITTDLDELTGDPRLRQNIRNLIQGLTGLVSDNPAPTASPKEQE